MLKMPDHISQIVLQYIALPRNFSISPRESLTMSFFHQLTFRNICLLTSLLKALILNCLVVEMESNIHTYLVL